MLRIIPPRKQLVRHRGTPTTGFLCERTLCHLRTLPPTLMLSKLVSGDQLVASVDGSAVAMIFTLDTSHECVQHSHFRSPMRFYRRNHRESGTRILAVDNEGALVWGRSTCGRTGLWNLRHGEVSFLAPLSELRARVGQGAIALDTGAAPEQPGRTAVILEDGIWWVEPSATVRPYMDTVCILEPLGGFNYAYEVRDGMTVHGFHLVHEDGMQPVDVIHWRGRLLVVYAGSERSMIRQVGQAEQGERPFKMEVFGRIERVWTSPEGNSLLTLLRPPNAHPGQRMLFLNHGQLIHKGVFTIQHGAVTWSSCGRSVACQIMDVDQKTQVVPMVVTETTKQRLPVGMQVRETLVDVDGRIQSMVLCTNRQCAVHVPGLGSIATGTFAWNLHDEGGETAFNLVQGHRILTVRHDY